MRGKLFLLLLCFSLPLLAKKAPKWKPGAFTTDDQGMRYSIKKEGKGDSVYTDEYVRVRMYFYNTTTGKYDRNLWPSQSVKNVSGQESIIHPTDELMDNEIIRAVLKMREGGKAFFVFQNESPALMSLGDSSYCFIEVLKIEPVYDYVAPPSDSDPDTVQFVMPDPNAGNFGDTLFTSAKLLHAPNVVSCGGFDVTQVFEFELSWFDNGVQHKNILIYIHCPDFYGKDFFVEGKSYIITAIPLTDNKKRELNAIDQFPNENVERYFLLRIK